jgi:hypothetical protein
MMSCELLKTVRESFDKLWLCQKAEKGVIEVITPYSFFGNKFIGIFIKLQNDEYIVNDGGVVHDLLDEKKLRLMLE